MLSVLFHDLLIRTNYTVVTRAGNGVEFVCLEKLEVKLISCLMSFSLCPGQFLLEAQDWPLDG